MDEAGYSVTLDDYTEGVVVVRYRTASTASSPRSPRHRVWFDEGMVCGMLGADLKAHRRTDALSAGDDSAGTSSDGR